MRKRSNPASAGDSFAGQVCLITGGAQGIGWAQAQAFAAAGAQVHVCDHSPAHLHRAQRELDGSRKIVLDQVDVTSKTAVDQWITGIGKADVYVHNAAFVRWSDVRDMSVEDAELSMRTGYEGLVYGVKAVLPLMLEAGGGHIVAMGSSAGRLLVVGPSAAYAAAKAAIEAYTEILRIELASTPVAVTLIRPGVVTGTDFFKTHVRSDRMPRLVDFLPPATPDQVAGAVVDGVRKRKTVVDIPGYLPAMYRIYCLSPALFRYLTTLGGQARHDYTRTRP
ncbi:SDR family NAD(P)-dependent oxidoreductase [Streptomyces sp. NPDC050085]|uniref:SDR family NAD(P)-dependent oxidoreductase n=1 Tax=Streptomyces sp. NPDC050085 TaxID=3365600 RepID=UPI0037B62FFF